MQDLALKLSADTAELKKGMQEANKSLDSINKNTKNLGRDMSLAFGKIAIAIGAVNTAFKAVEGTIKSTQTTGDKLEQTLGGIDEGLNYVQRSLANMDFNNFLAGLRNAIEAGKEYKAILDEIADRNRALSIRDARLKRDIAKLDAVIYSNSSTAEQKQAAMLEKRILLETHLNQLQATRQMALDAEIDRIRKVHNLTEEQAKSVAYLFENYDTITDEGQLNRIKQIIDAQERLNKLQVPVARTSVAPTSYGAVIPVKESTAMTETKAEIKELQDFLEANLAMLSTTEVAWMEAYKNITDDVRDRVGSVIKDMYGAESEIYRMFASLERQENRVSGGSGKVSDGSGAVDSPIIQLPEGSIAAIDEQINELRTRLHLATEQSVRDSFNAEIDQLVKVRDEMLGKVVEAFSPPEGSLAYYDQLIRANNELISLETDPARIQTLQAQNDELRKKQDLLLGIKEVEESSLLSFNEALQQSLDTLSLVYLATDGLSAAFNDLFSKGTEGMKGFVDHLLRVVQGMFATALASQIAAAAQSPQNIATGGLWALGGGLAGVTALSAIWKNLVPSFADGGIVYGETLARVGEYAGAKSNPEVIAPLNKLQGILENTIGSGINGEVRFVIEQDKLVGILTGHSNKQIYF